MDSVASFVGDYLAGQAVRVSPEELDRLARILVATLANNAEQLVAQLVVELAD
jgi:hypothetical protein